MVCTFATMRNEDPEIARDIIGTNPFAVDARVATVAVLNSMLLGGKVDKQVKTG